MAQNLDPYFSLIGGFLKKTFFIIHLEVERRNKKDRHLQTNPHFSWNLEKERKMLIFISLG
jgi:hypothetical protein